MLPPRPLLDPARRFDQAGLPSGTSSRATVEGCSIKREIDEQLAPLVGLPLRDASRVVDMATFWFGRLLTRQSRQGPIEVAEYRLHIQETWRITRDGRVLLGYGDWHYPPRGSTVSYDDFIEKDERHNRQDDLREDWTAHGEEAHTVASAEGSETGDLAIRFVDGCLLDTFVNQATEGDHGDDEFWRLLPPESVHLDGPHFVVTARGTRS